MRTHLLPAARSALLAVTALLAACTASPPPAEAGDTTEATRHDAIARWTREPNPATALQLAHAYFPELQPAPPSRETGRDALTARPYGGGALELRTRGLAFTVTPHAVPTAPLDLRGTAAFAGARHLWWPAGHAVESPAGWRTARFEEAWILDELPAAPVHRATYSVELPDGVRRIRDTGGWLEFLDAASRPVLRFHPSIVRDANGTSRDGRAWLGAASEETPGSNVLTVDGSTLELTTEVQLTGLVPPLVIDPGWSSTDQMAIARGQHAAIQLPSGQVLVVNGVNRTGFVGTAELYDPETATWSSAGPTPATGNVTSALLLPTGDVFMLTDAGPSGWLYNPASATWTATGPMATLRSLPTLTLLRSGQVLVAGGAAAGGRLETAELYDPATNAFTPTGSMSAARSAHTSALLRDGRVLAVSGFSNDGEVPSAELCDPSAGTWSQAAPPLVPRHYATSTVLPDGRVLLAGGVTSAGVTAVAELFDPVANTWTATGALAHPRNGHTATLLPSGKVVVIGGSPDSRQPQLVPETYDPATGTWTAAPPTAVGRENPTATLLTDGKVLVAGGISSPGTLTFYADVEVYRPDAQRTLPLPPGYVPDDHPLVALLPSGQVLVTGGAAPVPQAARYDARARAWLAAPPPAAPHHRGTATLLASGEVLVVGGWNTDGSATETAERYDPGADAWRPAAPLTAARARHTATRLPDGRVLVVGGEDGQGIAASPTVYTPETDAWQAAAAPAIPRTRHAAALLPDGRVLIAGGENGAGAGLASAELYEPTAGTWSPASSLPRARAAFTLTLLPNGEVLAAGGSGDATAEIYDIVTNTWRPTAALHAPRTDHAATLLPSGVVLVAGGDVGTFERFDPALGVWTVVAPDEALRLGALALPSGEALALGGTSLDPAHAGTHYDDVGPLPAWRPVVTGPDVLTTACPVTIEGQGFRGISTASGGSYLDSPVDLPLVRLKDPESGRLWTLPGSGMSATATTVDVPAGIPQGTYALTVFSSGIPGGRAVTVRENQAPTALPATVSTPEGTPVAITLQGSDPDEHQLLSWALATAPVSGTVSGTPPVITYLPDPGFVGTDAFTFVASDCGLESAPATITVHVTDATPPAITCPANVTIEATDASGAAATWPDATATEGAIAYAPARGSALPLGSTTIAATATDETGNTATCTFDVLVRDTTPPALTCPADVMLTATGPDGAPAAFDPAAATDAVTAAPALSYSVDTGGTLPVGSTTVTVRAVDDAGNEAACTFEVTVREASSPAGDPGVARLVGGGCQSADGAAPAGALLVLGLLAWFARWRRVESAAIVAVVGLAATGASAQTSPMNLERLRFDPAGTDALLVDTGRLLDEGSYRLSLLGNYERGVLLVRTAADEEHPLVRDRAVFWLAGAWSPIAGLELSARLPVITGQGGADAGSIAGVSAPSSSGLGTPEVGARLAVLGDRDPLRLALGLDVGLPGGSASAFGRQDAWSGMSVAPRVALSTGAGPFVIGGNAGVRMRGTSELPGPDVGSELEQSVVVANRGEGLRGEVALHAAESLVSSDVAVELLGGVRLPIGSGFEAYGAAGHGFTDMPGTPSLRMLAGVAWTQAPARRTGARPVASTAPHVVREPGPVAVPAPAAPNAAAPAPAVPGEVDETLSADALIVNFAVGQAEFGAEGQRNLDAIARYLERHAEAHVQIHGHTDGSGTRSINDPLSLERAARVRDALAERGVSPDRLHTTGLGSTRPIASNDTEAGRRANRRVDLVIVAGASD